MGEVLIRPMRVDDVPVAERLSAESFHELDQRTARRSGPAPVLRPPGRGAAWVDRTTRWLDTDAAGCWVAEQDGAMLGFATSAVRDTTWILATFAVRPGLQGRGLGVRLLEAAMQHGRGCLHAMLSSSADPRATRRYHRAGFVLHPQMQLAGTVDRSAIPVVEKVRDGSPADTDLMDSVDRQVRGAAHGPDHAYLHAAGRSLVSDTTTGSGYAFVDPDGALLLLAATNRRTATRLLWAVIADGPAEQRIGHLTAANHWALEVGFAARLELDQEGYLALRGLQPPVPYIHHGALL